eukprot:Gb_06341 [translate_table: standard]
MLEEESKKLDYERSTQEMKSWELESHKKAEEVMMSASVFSPNPDSSPFLHLKQSRKDLADALESQIRSRNAADYLAKELKQEEFESSKIAKAQYESRVKEAISSSAPEGQYRRKTAKWYE